MARRSTPILLVALALAACSGAEQKQSEPRPGTPITTAVAEKRTVEDIEKSVGHIETNLFPEVAAETSGRVVEVLADVGDRVETGELLVRLNDEVQRFNVRSAAGAVERLSALVDNQKRTVRRLKDLVARNSASQSQLDEAEAQLASLRAQLKEAHARLDEARYALAKTSVQSPVSGAVEERMVSRGDYVTTGMTLFRLVNDERLQIFLPFPETLADRFETGLTVRLYRPSEPDRTVTGKIDEIRPMVGSRSRAVEVIVYVDNPGGWRAGATVTGEVVLARRESVVVPEGSLVQRPDGKVVYVVEGDSVIQHVVETGIQRGGRVEVLSGLEAGARVAVDGASYLTDGARVAIRGDQ